MADVVLDMEQFRNFTLEDRQLMRDILGALIDDASRQMALLDGAIRDNDGPRTARLARYSARACGNVGANAVAAAFKSIERHAASGEFESCSAGLEQALAEVAKLRAEAASL